MKDRSDKRFCTLDHANKRRELARQTPYEFWLRQVARDGRQDPRGEHDPTQHRRHAGPG